MFCFLRTFFGGKKLLFWRHFWGKICFVLLFVPIVLTPPTNILLQTCSLIKACYIEDDDNNDGTK